MKPITCSQPVEVGSYLAILDHEGSLDFVRLVEQADINVGASSVVHISRWSPLGSSLLGRVSGDFITFESPGGEQTVEILATSRQHFDAVKNAVALELGGDHRSAACVYSSIDNFASAARRFVLAGSLADAAEAFERAEYHAEAAQLCESIGNFEQAGVC